MRAEPGGPPGRASNRSSGPPIKPSVRLARTVMKYLTEEFLSARTLRSREEPIRRRNFDNLALVHENHPVGDLARKPHLMGDDQHRHAALGEFDHDVEHFA